MVTVGIESGKGHDLFLLDQEEKASRPEASSKLGARQADLTGKPKGRRCVSVVGSDGKTHKISFGEYVIIEGRGKAGTPAELKAKREL